MVWIWAEVGQLQQPIHITPFVAALLDELKVESTCEGLK